MQGGIEGGKSARLSSRAGPLEPVARFKAGKYFGTVGKVLPWFPCGTRGILPTNLKFSSIRSNPSIENLFYFPFFPASDIQWLSNRWLRSSSEAFRRLYKRSEFRYVLSLMDPWRNIRYLISVVIHNARYLERTHVSEMQFWLSFLWIPR